MLSTSPAGKPTRARKRVRSQATWILVLATCAALLRTAVIRPSHAAEGADSPAAKQLPRGAAAADLVSGHGHVNVGRTLDARQAETLTLAALSEAGTAARAFPAASEALQAAKPTTPTSASTAPQQELASLAPSQVAPSPASSIQPAAQPAQQQDSSPAAATATKTAAAQAAAEAAAAAAAAVAASLAKAGPRPTAGAVFSLPSAIGKAGPSGGVGDNKVGEGQGSVAGQQQGKAQEQQGQQQGDTQEQQQGQQQQGEGVQPQALLDEVLAMPQHPAGRTPCDALLQVPKVALMFMVTSEVHHEALWRKWVGAVAGTLPRDAVQRFVGAGAAAPGSEEQPGSGQPGADGRGVWSAERLQQLREVCGPQLSAQPGGDASGPGVLDTQLLFNFYIHAHPEFPGYPPTSLFARAMVPRRVRGEHGSHSLVDVERMLLGDALRDPLNQRFLILSETHLPLYSAGLLYHQVFAEPKARLDACTYKTQRTDNLERWRPQMEPAVTKMHWRKSSHWYTLHRKHAEVLAHDVQINDAFHKYCKTRRNPIYQRYISCSSTEHYPPVVLAVHGLANETTCFDWGTTYVDWTVMTTDGRPRSFIEEEVNDDLIARARSASKSGQCSPQQTEGAIRTAALQLLSIADLLAGDPAALVASQPPYQPFGDDCALLVRKFPASLVARASEVFGKYVQVL